MQIYKKRKHTLLYTLAVIAIIGAGIGIYWFTHSANESGDESKQKINIEKPTEQQTRAGKNSKDATVKGRSENTGNLNTGETAQPEDNSVTPQIAITAASQNGDIVQVRSLIPIVTTSGSCTLTIKNGANTITKTASVQSLADSSTCQGFDISTNDFSVNGTWAATLVYTDANGSTQATKDIIIK